MTKVSELAAGALLQLGDTRRAGIKTLATPVYNVMGYGAKGDGVADDGVAIQQAIDEAANAGGGDVVFPTGTYGIKSSLMIKGDGVRLIGLGSGVIFTSPIIKWIGNAALDDTQALVYVLPARMGFTIEGFVLDANLLAGMCLHVDGADGSATHRPQMSRLHFKGYRKTAMVLGKNSTTSPGAVQMMIINCYNLSFEGGLFGAVGILINAQNAEFVNFFGLYFDPQPGQEHLHHIIQYRGGLQIFGLLTTRATDYPIISYEQVGIYGWRAEDRYLIDMKGVDPGGPSVIMNVTQRIHGGTLPDDAVIRIYHTFQVVTLSSLLLQGSIAVGPTAGKMVVATGVFFNQAGADFIFYGPQSQSGLFHNAATGELILRGTAPKIRVLSETGVAKFQITATGGLGVGNSAVATTLGTVVRKVEVFDASGNSLGFMPVYNSIT